MPVARGGCEEAIEEAVSIVCLLGEGLAAENQKKQYFPATFLELV
jgi:hypothetical protein